MKDACAKIIISIAIFAIACLACQKKKQLKIIARADSTCAEILGVDGWPHNSSFIDKELIWIKSKFHLDTVTQRKNFELRIFLDDSFGGGLYINYTLTDNQWQGFQVQYFNQSGYKSEIKPLIPPKGWENFTKSLRNHKVFNLLTYNEIKEGERGKYFNGLNYGDGVDGTYYYIEVIADKQYEFRYYHDVDIDIVNYPHFVELQKLSEFLKLVIPRYTDTLKDQKAYWDMIRLHDKLIDTDSNSFIRR